MSVTDRPDAPTRAEPTAPGRGRPIGWGVTLIVIGVLWSLALSGVAVPWQLVLPGAVIVVGLLLLAIGPRASVDGMIGLGILLSVVAVTVSFAPEAVPLSLGERSHRPTELAALDPNQALGAGSLTIDLRGLQLPSGATTEVSGRVGFGELVVVVPADAVIVGDAAVAVGETSILGQERGGIAPNQRIDEVGPTDGKVLRLDLQVGFGRIEVTR